MKTTAYIVHKAGGPFILEEVELDGLRKGEALVKLKATGLCHTGIVHIRSNVYPYHLNKY